MRDIIELLCVTSGNRPAIAFSYKQWRAFLGPEIRLNVISNRPVLENECVKDSNLLISQCDAIGACEKRNIGMKMIHSTYVLLVDDDSFPVSGNLNEAISFMASHGDCGALALLVYNTTTERLQSASEHAFKLVKTFVACGAIIDRKKILAIGGFSESLIYYGEESDLTARLFIEKKFCYNFPQIEVHHQTEKGRNNRKAMFLLACNRTKWVLRFTPIAAVPYSLVRWFARCTVAAFRHGSTAPILGYAKAISGSFCKQEYSSHRRFNWSEYLEWSKLP